MIFNSYIFLFVFLPIAFAGFWILRGKQLRYLWLTIMSYIFYGYWNYKFAGLMLLSTVIDFFAAQIIANASTPQKKKVGIVISVIVNLALLGFFKYFNFGIDTLQSIFDIFQWQVPLPALNIILPVGISFYTFQSMSYTIDVYRGQLQPTKNFLEYATYVSLFPQLVAGPIVRFRDIVNDLENIHLLRKASAFHTGVSIFVIGLAKKVIIADSIASIINPLWNDPSALSAGAAWIAVLGYTYQLYFDFSGYSDMAVGLGRLFGFHFPQNFNSPYKAINISDFWRRWHITLSSWLRDYLYIPLGGSRLGTVRTYVNLFITMLLGGLWHGANWTFVIWGSYHGALLALYKMVKNPYDRLPIFLQRATTFFLVVIGWVFFRSPTFGAATAMLTRMFGGAMAGTGALLAGGALMTAVILLAFCFLATNFFPNTFEWQFSKKPRYAVALAAVAVLSLIFMNYQQSVFLYYQF